MAMLVYWWLWLVFVGWRLSSSIITASHQIVAISRRLEIGNVLWHPSCDGWQVLADRQLIWAAAAGQLLVGR